MTKVARDALLSRLPETIETDTLTLRRLLFDRTGVLPRSKRGSSKSHHAVGPVTSQVQGAPGGLGRFKKAPSI